jgi:hypothetical protein
MERETELEPATSTDLRDACGIVDDRFLKWRIARLWRHRAASEEQENR